MSAMNMDFICKDSPETKPAPPPNANAKLSNLLNSAAALDDSDEDDDRVEVEEEDAAASNESDEAMHQPPSPPPPPSLPPQANGRGIVLPPLKKMKLAAPSPHMASEPVPQYHDLPEADAMDASNGVSDNENSEDEQVEYAPWEDIDLNPAVDLVRSVSGRQGEEEQSTDIDWVLR
jgi:hypothetical protein